MSRCARARLLLALVGSALLTSALACGGGSQRRNGVHVVHRGGDVLASGGMVHVTDSVPGDAMLAGGNLEFSGATGGDYLGAGGSQVITGRIHGSARVAGGEIRVAAPIDRNATIAGGNIELDGASIVGHNAYLAGGTVRVAGTVRQVLHVTGGTVVLDGAVGGNVEVDATELRVGSRAAIAGSMRYRVPREKVHIDSAAQIAGTVTALPARDWRGTLLVFRLVWLLGFLLAGAVAVALAPRFARDAAERLQLRPGLSVLLGIVWLIVVPIICVLIAITLIGLPLALLLGAVYMVLAYVGRFVLAVWLGQRMLGDRVRPGTAGAVVSFLAGAIILAIVALVPLLGPLVTLAATVCGLGALLLAIRAWGRAPVTG